jgi:hypothetical protein
LRSDLPTSNICSSHLLTSNRPSKTLEPPNSHQYHKQMIHFNQEKIVFSCLSLKMHHMKQFFKQNLYDETRSPQFYKLFYYALFCENFI